MPHDLDDIEANRIPERSLPSQPEMCGVRHVTLFAEIDGLRRKSEADMRSRAHLDKDKNAFMGGNQVDLPSPLSHISGDNPVATRLEERRRGLLPEGPSSLLFVGLLPVCFLRRSVHHSPRITTAGLFGHSREIVRRRNSQAVGQRIGDNPRLEPIAGLLYRPHQRGQLPEAFTFLDPLGAG